ncbi:MAG: undecaprenyl-phosphate galactose phosphotransferase WbaP [Rhizomicrobium sp.]
MRSLRHWISKVSLVLADVTAFTLATLLFRLGHTVPELLFYQGLLPINTPVDLFYILGLFFIVVRYISGDYGRRELFWDGARRTTISLLFASTPCLLLLIFSNGGYSASAIIGSWAFVIVAVPALRQIARRLLSLISVWQVPTALVGDGPNALEAYKAFRNSLSLGFDVRFLITLRGSPESVEAISADVTRIGLRDPVNIVRRLSEAGCQEVVMATEHPQDEETEELLQNLMAAGIGVAIIPPLGRLPLLGMTMNYFIGRDLLLLQVRDNLRRLPARMLKRLIDIIGSTVLLILLSPIFALFVFLIRREDGGPAFFVQPRAGRNGREFNCIKFRTMTIDAEEQLSRWRKEKAPLYEEYMVSNFKLRSDPRATRIGQWLRRTSLDELPQLINVLIGDMSLVGPRPLLCREIGEYGVTFKLYQQIRPGITGLWQISGRSHTRFADRVASDEWYIKNWSFWYDIVILLETVGVLVTKDGAY